VPVMTETNTLIPLKVHGVLVDPNTDTQIVVLRDEKNSEVLPIWVGTAEGTSIRLALENVIPPRPMSHDLICSFVSHLGFTLNKVVITEVKNNTYFSTLFLSKDDLEKSVDSRPSDAIALALRCQCPIYVTPEVLERRGGEDLDTWLSKLDQKGSEQADA
jgi:bifunctional DNase/RNase